MSVALEIQKATNRDVFEPIRPDYADFDVDVRDSFPWNEIFDCLNIPPKQQVVLFAFRSKKLPGADIHKLAMLDEKALLAAEGSPGFIHYKPLDGLSYCLWESQEAAEAATSVEAHRDAAKYAVHAYERWSLNCWAVGKSSITGQVEFAQIR